MAELTYQCPLHCPYCSNPVGIGEDRYRDILNTDTWVRVVREAAALGVVQLGLTGGEPLVRRDLEPIVDAARNAGLYTTLVTSATMLTARRAAALQEAGLDHVQISFQDSDPGAADDVAGTTAHARKLAAAELVVELGFPLTVNVVLHRGNLDRIEAIIEMAEALGAARLELANTQYYGWAVANQAALMPSREQLDRADAAVAAARARLGTTMAILYVLPDHYEDLPKPCMGGWGRTALIVAPHGDVLPCQAAADIPGLQFDNVRERAVGDIWMHSTVFEQFRGTDWMQEPCRSCPLDRQEVDFGGCRCQALRLAGDAAATDPVCRYSPHHAVVTEQQRDTHDGAPPPAWLPRTMRRSGAPSS